MIDLPSLDALYWIGGAALSSPWWLRYGIRGPAAPEPEPELNLGPVYGSDIHRVWAERVGTSDGALPGAELVDVRPVANGHAATIQLVPGKQTTESAVAATARIRSAYRKPVGSVIVEPTPAGEGDLARLLVIERNPLWDTHRWTTPHLGIECGGVTPCGMYADGEQALIRWWVPKSGPRHWLVAGSPGSGKTAFLDWTLTESVNARFTDAAGTERALWVTLLADGQGGQSIPHWVESDGITWVGLDADETYRMVKAAVRDMRRRNRVLRTLEWTDEDGYRRRGLNHFDPMTACMPFLQVVIDELPMILDARPDILPLLIELAAGGRKAGVRLVLCCQIPSVNQLGGSVDLRSLVASGQVIVFRTADRVSGGMAFAGGLAVDPSSLPESAPDGRTLEGVAYLKGAATRPTMLRTEFVEKAARHAAEAVAPLLHDADDATLADRRGWRLRLIEREEREDAALAIEDAEDPAASAAAQPAADAGAGDELAELIIGEIAAKGPRTPTQLMEASPGCSLRTMTDKLREMREMGLLTQPKPRAPHQLPDREPVAV